MIQFIVIFLIGIISLILTAVLFYRIKNRILKLSLISLSFIILLINPSNDNLHLLFSAIVAGAAAGFTFSLKKSFQFFLLLSTIIIGLALTGNYYILKHYYNDDLLLSSKEKISEVFRSSSDISDSDKKKLLDNIDDSFETITNIIPFSYFLNALVFSLISFYIIRTFFIRNFAQKDPVEKGIEFFKISDYFIFILIAGWSAVLLIDRSKYSIPFITGLNIALILTSLYLIQAFGIIKFFLQKKKIPSYILFVIFFVLILIGFEFVLFVLIVIAGLGILDFWSDFRGLENQKEK